MIERFRIPLTPMAEKLGTIERKEAALTWTVVRRRHVAAYRSDRRPDVEVGALEEFLLKGRFRKLPTWLDG